MSGRGTWSLAPGEMSKSATMVSFGGRRGGKGTMVVEVDPKAPSFRILDAEGDLNLNRGWLETPMYKEDHSPSPLDDKSARIGEEVFITLSVVLDSDQSATRHAKLVATYKLWTRRAVRTYSASSMKYNHLPAGNELPSARSIEESTTLISGVSFRVY